MIGRLYNHLTVDLHIHKMLFHGRRIHLEQICRLAKQLLLRQISMAVGSSLQEDIEKPCLDPVIRIRVDTHPAGDLICQLKAWLLYTSLLMFSYLHKFVSAYIFCYIEYFLYLCVYYTPSSDFLQ